MLKLFIQSSKTGQYRDGAWTVVASSGKATCPVAIVNRYLERAGLSCGSPLFCQLFPKLPALIAVFFLKLKQQSCINMFKLLLNY